MPWIGLYIAAASALCVLAMIMDVIDGVRRKKLWFPCKYFSLNATSITLLAVAMKFAMDLTPPMKTFVDEDQTDILACQSSLIFMSTAMGNIMPSLGSTSNKATRANVIALGILVMTISVDLLIQLNTVHGEVQLVVILLYLIPTSFMLLLFATTVSWAIVLPASKRSLDYNYQKMQKFVLRDDEVVKKMEGFRIGKEMIVQMKRYLVMAETSNPQFVMARLAVCATSSIAGLFSSVALVFIFIRMRILYANPKLATDYTSYKESTALILLSQFIGVAVGTIAPTWRFFLAISFKCSTIRLKEIRKEFQIEEYWIQTLVYWRDSFTSSQAQHHNWWKYLHSAKWYSLSFCIRLQIFFVLISKLHLFISTLFISQLLSYFNRFCGNQHCEAQSGDIVDELDLRSYVLLLEDEIELPKRVLKNINQEADRVIQRGKKKQPQNLMHLLEKFNNFNGVREFDSNRVENLHFEEPHNCWTLPLVTLTGIAIALPNVANHETKQLVSSVREGLYFAKLIDKTLDATQQLLNIRKAADVTWPGVALYQKWQHINLKRTSLKCKKLDEVLNELSTNAKRTVVDFKKNAKDSQVENLLNWPVGIIAANSMYRISKTILLICQGENVQTGDEMFMQLSVMISDILAACLTNLPSVIMKRCLLTSIEKQEKSVLKAFLLLGKTEKILELLHQRPWPSIDYHKPTSIDEWRAHESSFIP